MNAPRLLFSLLWWPSVAFSLASHTISDGSSPVYRLAAILPLGWGEGRGEEEAYVRSPEASGDCKLHASSGAKTALRESGRHSAEQSRPLSKATLQLQILDGAIVRGPVPEKKIALVFTGHEFADGGEVILRQLASHKAKASFFLTGDFLDNTNFSRLVKRIIAEGHYLGPHSDRHLLYCSWDRIPKTLVAKKAFELDVSQNITKISRFGRPASAIKYFLPAYEHFNAEIAEWTKGMDLILINYTPGTRSNADYTGEADKNFVSSKAIFESVVAKGQQDPHGLNGFLLLLHIGSGPGRADKFHLRIGELLDYLAAKSYQFVRVDDLLEGK